LSGTTKICRIEIAAEKEGKNNLIAIRGFQLVDFGGLLFPALVDVGKITGRLRFDEKGQVWQVHPYGLDYCVNGNLDGLSFRPGGFHQDIETEGEGAGLHLCERSRGGRRLQLIAP